VSIMTRHSVMMNGAEADDENEEAVEDNRRELESSARIDLARNFRPRSRHGS
jgi:hypothetical protein